MGKAEWVMPSIDVDEYLRFSGQKISTSFYDRLTQLVDGANIREISFTKYDFLMPQDPMTMLDTTSQLRGQYTAHECPKYVYKPDLVYTLFIHWTSSYVSGSRRLAVATKTAVVHHYRNTNPRSGRSLDPSLVEESVFLSTELQITYGVTWSDLAPTLRPSKLVWTSSNPLAVLDVLPTSSSIDSDHNECECAKEAFEFVRKSNSLTGDARLEAPQL